YALFLLLLSAVPRALPSFPTRRSSDLETFEDAIAARLRDHGLTVASVESVTLGALAGALAGASTDGGPFLGGLVTLDPAGERGADRKSTRLNSSHGSISYAVFCLKKKR